MQIRSFPVIARVVLAVLVLAQIEIRPARAQSSRVEEPVSLEELRTAAERANSDAVIILQHGRPVAEWYFGGERRPIEVMSVLKSLVGIAVGKLITDGLIESLDQPVHTLYPEWKQGLKQQITIRHLLNHTSGLQNVPNAGAEIYPSPDAVRLALAAELEAEPGTVFSYNNKAVNLLAGIIEKASGQRMDQYFRDEFFLAMGISEYEWYYDESGTPHAMAGLKLHAFDLAKFGQLVLQAGVWEGEQLVRSAYMEEMLGQGQDYDPRFGLLWWRLPREAYWMLDASRITAGTHATEALHVLARLRPLEGRRFATRSERDAVLESALGAEWQSVLERYTGSPGAEEMFVREYGPIVAFYGDGYLGQTLLVVPDLGIVAVRQVEGGDGYNAETDGFPDFKRLVLRLAERTHSGDDDGTR